MPTDTMVGEIYLVLGWLEVRTLIGIPVHSKGEVTLPETAQVKGSLGLALTVIIAEWTCGTMALMLTEIL